MRTVADVSAVAGPSTGVAVYDSFGFGPFHWWFLVGGTSVSSPGIAGMVAAAGAGSTLDPADLYASPGNFYDVTKGTNGFCKHNYMGEGPSGVRRTHRPRHAKGLTNADTVAGGASHGASARRR